MLWAVEKGITNGTTATTFGPLETCNRGQIVTFLYRFAGKPAASGSNPFTDVKTTDYYYNAVRWAVSEGITTGTTRTTFSPLATCERGQVVTFLYRYMN
ncbi:MAG: S-layer homology domain-containing protein [Clostridia bacterium]|nr:S-layer homology domain-containing protein [Clostridia bacterium]